MSKFILQMLGQADRIAQSRSSVLVPIQWLLAILVTVFLALVLVKAPIWALVGDAICVCLLVGVAVFAYIFFCFKNPDYLRSEQHSLSKLAIEKGLYGDSDAGLIASANIGVLEPKSLLEARGR